MSKFVKNTQLRFVFWTLLGVWRWRPSKTILSVPFQCCFGIECRDVWNGCIVTMLISDYRHWNKMYKNWSLDCIKDSILSGHPLSIKETTVRVPKFCSHIHCEIKLHLADSSLIALFRDAVLKHWVTAHCATSSVRSCTALYRVIK